MVRITERVRRALNAWTEGSNPLQPSDVVQIGGDTLKIRFSLSAVLTVLVVACSNALMGDPQAIDTSIPLPTAADSPALAVMPTAIPEPGLIHNGQKASSLVSCAQGYEP